MGHQAKVKAQRHLERAKALITEAQTKERPAKAKPVERVLESHPGANRKTRRKIEAQSKAAPKVSDRPVQGRSVPKAEFDRLAAAKTLLQKEVAKWRTEAIKYRTLLKKYESGELMPVVG